MIFVAPPRGVRAWVRFESRSEPGRTHDAVQFADGTWSCECWPWWKNDDCLHVRAVRGWQRRGWTMSPGDLERWCVAVLRNALAHADGFAPQVGVPAAVEYIEAKRGMWDDGLNALRERLKTAADPLAEIRAELARLGHTGDGA